MIIKIKDEYSLRAKDLENAIRSILTNQGLVIDIDYVDSLEVLDQIQMIHAVHHHIVPTIFNSEEVQNVTTNEKQIISTIDKAMRKLYPKKAPEVYYSSRLFPRSSFPQLFAKQEDGSLALKESRLFSHFYQH